jgi:hypothetical protein
VDILHKIKGRNEVRTYLIQEQRNSASLENNKNDSDAEGVMSRSLEDNRSMDIAIEKVFML